MLEIKCIFVKQITSLESLISRIYTMEGPCQWDDYGEEMVFLAIGSSMPDSELGAEGGGKGSPFSKWNLTPTPSTFPPSLQI